MISTAEKAECAKKFGKTPTDTGSPSVQVAILTKRITHLTQHFGKHIHDYHSKRGLMKMIGRRKKLLRYVQQQDADSYTKLIKDLGLRK